MKLSTGIWFNIFQARKNVFWKNREKFKYILIWFFFNKNRSLDRNRSATLIAFFTSDCTLSSYNTGLFFVYALAECHFNTIFQYEQTVLVKNYLLLVANVQPYVASISHSINSLATKYEEKRKRKIRIVLVSSNDVAKNMVLHVKLYFVRDYHYRDYYGRIADINITQSRFLLNNIVWDEL